MLTGCLGGGSKANYKLTIKVMGESAPVEGASVVANSSTKDTDSKGIAIFEKMSGKVTVEVKAKGYKPETKTYQINKDETKEIRLEKSMVSGLINVIRVDTITINEEEYLIADDTDLYSYLEGVDPEIRKDAIFSFWIVDSRIAKLEKIELKSGEYSEEVMGSLIEHEDMDVVDFSVIGYQSEDSGQSSKIIGDANLFMSGLKFIGFTVSGSLNVKTDDIKAEVILVSNNLDVWPDVTNALVKVKGDVGGKLDVMGPNAQIDVGGNVKKWVSIQGDASNAVVNIKEGIVEDLDVKGFEAQVTVTGDVGGELEIMGSNAQVDVGGNVEGWIWINEDAHNALVKVKGDVGGKLDVMGPNAQVDVGGSIGHLLHIAEGANNSIVRVAGNLKEDIWINGSYAQVEVGGKITGFLQIFADNAIVTVDGDIGRHIFLDGPKAQITVTGNVGDWFLIFGEANDADVSIGEDLKDHLLLFGANSKINIGGSVHTYFEIREGASNAIVTVDDIGEYLFVHADGVSVKANEISESLYVNAKDFTLENLPELDFVSVKGDTILGYKTEEIFEGILFRNVHFAQVPETNGTEATYENCQGHGLK